MRGPRDRKFLITVEEEGSHPMLTMVTFHEKKKAQSEYMKYLKHVVSIQLLSKVCEASNEFPHNLSPGKLM